MARREARIDANIWEDPDFLGLSAIAQRLYFFLLSQRDLTHAGVIPLRERRWAGKSSTTDMAELDHALRELEAARFLVIDWSEGEVLIRSLMRRDKVYRQPNVMLSASDTVQPLASAKITSALLHEVERIGSEDLTESQVSSVTKMREALVKRLDELGGPPPFGGYENPSPKSSDNHPPHPSGEYTAVTTNFPEPRSPNLPPTAVRAYTRDAPVPAHTPAREAAPSQALALVPDEPRTPREIVSWWIAQCVHRPPAQVLGQMSRYVKELLDEGIDPSFVRQGIAEWSTKSLAPSTLPSIVNAIMNQKPATTKREATHARNRAVTQSIEAWEAQR